MLKAMSFKLLLLIPMLAPCQMTHAQAQPRSPEESIYSHINRQAALSRSGNSADADTELTHQLFTSASVPTDLADAFGFTDRIVKAENKYRHGSHAAVREADVIKAINNFADSIGAPAWAHTNQTEVRRLRMHMLTLYPQLMSSQGPPDATHHYKAINDDMRPIEGAYVATTMVYQKCL